MNTYNYLESVTSDAKSFILRVYKNEELKQAQTNRETFEENIYEDMFDQDCVTGNGYYGYHISKETAETYIWQNLELAEEAIDEFGLTIEGINKGYGFIKGANYLDTAIRCYLLREAVSDAVSEIISENQNLFTDNIQ